MRRRRHCIEARVEDASPRAPVDLRSLADGFMTLFEGAFILEKSLDEAGITYQQLRK